MIRPYLQQMRTSFFAPRKAPVARSRTPRPFRLGVEGLEGRAVPSVSPILVQGTSPVDVAHSAPHHANHGHHAHTEVEHEAPESRQGDDTVRVEIHHGRHAARHEHSTAQHHTENEATSRAGETSTDTPHDTAAHG